MDNLGRLSEETVTEGELKLSKTALVNAHQIMRVDVEGLAEELCWYERLGLGAEAYDAYADRINAVTAADIQRVARAHLNPRSYVFVGVKPRNS